MELEVGMKATYTKTVTIDDIQKYAEITGDYNPLHFDTEFASKTKFGKLVAQGGITSGMLNALVACYTFQVV
ncbi:MAG: MaoC/PaaZ C-terminal domain-containing protein [Candidatus Kariarchaeaceae archaeon]|jgi:acyl dehydratase